MRESFRFLAAGLSLLILAGCSETATSPSATPTRQLSASGPAFDYNSVGSSGSQTTTFTVTSSGGSFSVNGLFNVNFPANSVCNPTRSTYGSTEWDKPCSTLLPGESVTIQARLSLTSAGMAVDFSPELRFNPNTTVTISTDIFSSTIRNNRDYFLANPSSLGFLSVSYSPTLGGPVINDFAFDSSLQTHVGLTSGRIWRRIKHFSGYMIGNGEPCDPSPDNPDCIEVDQLM
jgi:hypothetical protein